MIYYCDSLVISCAFTNKSAVPKHFLVTLAWGEGMSEKVLATQGHRIKVNVIGATSVSVCSVCGWSAFD